MRPLNKMRDKGLTHSCPPLWAHFVLFLSFLPINAGFLSLFSRLLLLFNCLGYNEIQIYMFILLGTKNFSPADQFQIKLAIILNKIQCFFTLHFLYCRFCSKRTNERKKEMTKKITYTYKNMVSIFLLLCNHWESMTKWFLEEKEDWKTQHLTHGPPLLLPLLLLLSSDHVWKTKKI